MLHKIAGLLALLSTAVFADNASYAQNTFLPGQAIAVTKSGAHQATPDYTIYVNDNVYAAGSFNAVASFNNSRDLNGFGFNSRDSMLYGAAYNADTQFVATLLNVNLYRADANGQLSNLGKLPTSNQSATIALLGNIRAEIPNYTSGTVDSNGRYYYTTVGLNQTGINKVANAYFAYSLGGDPNLQLDLTDVRLYLCWLNNVHQLTGANMPTAPSGYKRVDFSDSFATKVFSGLISNLNAAFPKKLSTLKGGFQDMAFYPGTGVLYSYGSYAPSADTTSDSLAGRPVMFQQTSVANTLKIVPVGTTTNYLPGHEIAGLLFDSTARFYGLFNNGKFGEIDLNSGAIISTAQSSLPTTDSLLWGDMAGLAREGTLPPPAASIDVAVADNTAATIAAPGGTLQLTAAILPQAAAQDVTWHIVPVSGTATISAAGLVTGLTAGTVYGKAVALSDTLVADSLLITINALPVSVATLATDLYFELYPNPVSSLLHIVLPSPVKSVDIVITDLTGKVWLHTQNSAGKTLVVADLQHCPTGMYFVRVTNSQASLTRKIQVR